jgi:hypothetical protein
MACIARPLCSSFDPFFFVFQWEKKYHAFTHGCHPVVGGDSEEIIGILKTYF